MNRITVFRTALGRASPVGREEAVERRRPVNSKQQPIEERHSSLTALLIDVSGPVSDDVMGYVGESRRSGQESSEDCLMRAMGAGGKIQPSLGQQESTPSCLGALKWASFFSGLERGAFLFLNPFFLNWVPSSPFPCL
jgi:hypothetical protein